MVELSHLKPTNTAFYHTLFFPHCLIKLSCCLSLIGRGKDKVWEEKYLFFSLQLPEKGEKCTGFVMFVTFQASHKGLCKKSLKTEVILTFLCEPIKAGSLLCLDCLKIQQSGQPNQNTTLLTTLREQNLDGLLGFPHLLDQRANVERREWSLFSWFNDQSVSTAQSWCHLPNQHQQGEVPLQEYKALLRSACHSHLLTSMQPFPSSGRKGTGRKATKRSVCL